MSRKRFEQGFRGVFGGARSTAQSKKPRVVRGSRHAHVAVSKLVQIILAGRLGFESLLKFIFSGANNPFEDEDPAESLIASGVLIPRVSFKIWSRGGAMKSVSLLLSADLHWGIYGGICKK